MTDTLDNKVVAAADGFDYTRAELSAYFDMVKNDEHWKNPIDKIVRIKDFRTKVGIREAVVFYTGSTPSFTPTAGHFRVTAAGYYMTIGA